MHCTHDGTRKLFRLNAVCPAMYPICILHMKVHANVPDQCTARDSTSKRTPFRAVCPTIYPVSALDTTVEAKSTQHKTACPTVYPITRCTRQYRISELHTTLPDQCTTHVPDQCTADGSTRLIASPTRPVRPVCSTHIGIKVHLSFGSTRLTASRYPPSTVPD